MRTTVRLPDALMRKAKREAQRRGVTLTSLIERGLCRELSSGGHTRQHRVSLPISKMRGGVLPGVDLSNNAQLLDIVDGPQ
jgi:hypothetical protein